MQNPYLILSLALPALAWAILQVAYFWPRMPDRIASHFNFSGDPDCWMTKKPFVIVYAFVMILFVLLSAGPTPGVLPALYILPAVYHFAFSFNTHPEQQRLSVWVWVIAALLILAMVGFQYTLIGV